MTSPPSSPPSWMPGVNNAAPGIHGSTDRFRRGSSHHGGSSQHGGIPAGGPANRGRMPPGMRPRRDLSAASEFRGRVPNYYMPSSSSGDPNPRFAYGQFPFPGYGGPPPPPPHPAAQYYWPYRPWYPGMPHNFQMSGPHVDVARQIPFMDESTFADAFRAEMSKTTPALHGVRDFLHELGELTKLLEDLKARFAARTNKVEFSSQETLSAIWKDFITTRGALEVEGFKKKEQKPDDKSGERGIHLLQKACEILRQRLNGVKYEGAQTGTETESVGSVLERTKKSGADIVSAILLMPRNLKYVDQALADTAGLSRYLEAKKDQWRTGEDWKEIGQAKEEEDRKRAEAEAPVQEGENLGSEE